MDFLDKRYDPDALLKTVIHAAELGRAASLTIRERCSPKAFAERSGALLMADAALC